MASLSLPSRSAKFCPKPFFFSFLFFYDLFFPTQKKVPSPQSGRHSHGERRESGKNRDRNDRKKGGSEGEETRRMEGCKKKEVCVDFRHRIPPACLVSDK